MGLTTPKYIITLAICLLVIGTVRTQNDDLGELVFVMLLTRHGARSPSLPAPDNSTITDKKWNITIGDLTEVGERQHFLLGDKTARHYRDEVNFLSEDFDPREITVLSTDFNRTIMSAYSELMAYYPFNKAKNLTSEEIQIAKPPFPFDGEVTAVRDLKNAPTKYGYNPIPIHVGNIDAIMRGMDTDICPYQKKLREEYTESKEWDEINDKYQAILFPEMVEKFNADNETIDFTDAYPYIDNYYSAWFDQMEIINPLSAKAQDEVNMILRDGLYEGFFGLDEAVRLATSRYFNFLYTTIERKLDTLMNAPEAIDYYKELKFMYLSAHDSTISAIMSGLESKQDEQVYFASHIRTEIYKKPGATNYSDFTVRMIYNDKPFTPGMNLTCADNACSFPELKDYLQSREFDGDIDKTCFGESKDDNAAEKAWKIVLYVIIAFIAASIALYMICMRSKPSNEGQEARKRSEINNSYSYDTEKLQPDMQQTSAADTRMITDNDSD